MEIYFRRYLFPTNTISTTTPAFDEKQQSSINENDNGVLRLMRNRKMDTFHIDFNSQPTYSKVI